MKRTSTVLGLAAILTAVGGAAAAQEQSNPYWSSPVQQDLAGKLYPGFAALLGESGRVRLLCPIQADGHPYLCEVVDEAPRGLGFGAAARVVVASAEVGAARRDGVVVPSRIQTAVRFRMPDRRAPYGGWTGPEPTPATLALAREMVEERVGAEGLPPVYREQMLDGLDHDRRAVVTPWLDELFPRDAAREKAVMAIQMARLFDEAQLRRLRAGAPVDWPSEAEFLAACPDPTPADLAAMEELRRRYCERYECGVDAMAPVG
ncbi:energy transducer TonB [Brevundimonas sp.]|uniref:energy transducer TonB n=1 Tax=Brevundimonas sp. TaxID=1871086 RepID=UPI002D717911|nr:energy transducer TonB [Brevundimonas sp.]HYC99081.1 energy transducer TonB [Brevundimonas sp.]